MKLIPVKTPLVEPEDDLADILIKQMRQQNVIPQDNDVLVMAESAVATSEGRVVELSSVNPGKDAVELGTKYEVDPREAELILQESDEILGGIPSVILTVVRGNIMPNAGIDSSNAPPDSVILLPSDPQESATRIRGRLQEEFHIRMGVIIADSRTYPMKVGCTGTAIGCAGIQPVEDLRGSKDLYGRELKITRKATADILASAAQMLMGEAGESVPAVLIRGATAVFIDGAVEIPGMSVDECMYMGALKHDGSDS